MNFTEIYNQFFTDLANTRWFEYLAVFSGILSVWFSTKENILVYPIGLISTVIYVFISTQQHLLGEATVNFYYTVMSIVGWYLWTYKNIKQETVLQITKSNSKEWLMHFLFFGIIYLLIFVGLTYYKTFFNVGPIPWADAFASATAFTGMWLMVKKKVESWYWWIATNIASIPLYFVKHYVFTSVYYFVLLIMAVFGLISWLNKYKTAKAIT